MYALFLVQKWYFACKLIHVHIYSLQYYIGFLNSSSVFPFGFLSYDGYISINKAVYGTGGRIVPLGKTDNYKYLAPRKELKSIGPLVA